MAKITSLKHHAEDWISLREAAVYLGVSVRTLQRDVEKGALPVHTIGSTRVRRILITDFRNYAPSTEEHPSMKRS